MPHDVSDEDVAKHTICRELFANTADENYLVARWSYFNSLNIDFAWSALHAIEKYSKAVLLINGRSAIDRMLPNGRRKSFSHDIVALYDEITSIAGPLLPVMLIKPSGFGSWWRDEPTRDFLARLYRDGNADNRYDIYGYSQHPCEVHKLDMVVFYLRRLCLPLDAYVLPETSRSAAGGVGATLSNREMLARSPTYWDQFSGRLAKVMTGADSEAMQEIALRQNFAFLPAGKYPTTIEVKSSSHNPVLVRHVLDPLTQGAGDARDQARAVGRWAIDNIKLPASVVQQIEAAIADP